MKKWLIFSLLKILEMTLFVFVPYGIGQLGYLIVPVFFSPCPKTIIGMWAMGFPVACVAFVAIAIPAFVVIVLVRIIKANIEWAEKLTE